MHACLHHQEPFKRFLPTSIDANAICCNKNRIMRYYLHPDRVQHNCGMHIAAFRFPAAEIGVVPGCHNDCYPERDHESPGPDGNPWNDSNLDQ
jgi:hypothetical protein